MSDDLDRLIDEIYGAAGADPGPEQPDAGRDEDRSGQDEGGFWVPSSIMEGVDLSAPTPAPTILSLFYAGKAHLVSARPEAAKTWFVLTAGAEVVRGGGRVVIVDADLTGRLDLVRRLMALGLPEDEIAERVAYYEDAGELLVGRALPRLVGWVGRRADEGEVVLIVFDTVDKVVAALGRSLDAEGYVTAHAAVFRPLLRAGATLISVDHVAMRSTDANPYSINTQNKHGDADVHLRLVSRGAPLQRGGGPATFVILGPKDRPGGIERHTNERHVGRVTFTPGDETMEVVLDLGPPTAAEVKVTFRPTLLMERVSRWAALQPAPWSKKSAENDVKGTGQYIRLAVDVLLSEGFLDGGEEGYRHARDYRVEDDPEADDDSGGSSGGSSSSETRRGGPKSEGGSSPRRSASQAGSRDSEGGSSSASSSGVAGGSSSASSPLRGRDADDPLRDDPDEGLGANWREQLPDDLPGGVEDDDHEREEP